ncbi:MAG: hypothetical protein RL150_643 [Candidatus Parcubacteria bacterium]|jgi:methionyl-tRNA synthetase
MDTTPQPDATKNEVLQNDAPTVSTEPEVCAIVEPKISIDDFKKIEVTVGQILSVEIVPDADKLLRLSVDFGEATPRQIVSGIRMYFEDPQVLVGKRVPFATNLAPRVIKGLESNGMIMAVNDKNGNGFSLLEAGDNISPGSRVS